MLSENAVVTVLSFLKVLEMRRCDTSIFVEVVGIGVGCLSHIDVSQGRSSGPHKKCRPSCRDADWGMSL